MSHTTRPRQPSLPHRASTTLAAVAAFIGALTATAANLSAHETASPYLFVPNRGSGDIAVIDTARDSVAALISVGQVPHQVAVSQAARRIVASNTADNTITIIDLDSWKPVATLVLGIEPEHMQLNADGTLLAVGNIGAGTVSLVSLALAREIARVDGLIAPHNPTFSPNGKRLYVANLGADFVSVIDVAQGRVVDEISVSDPTPMASKGQVTDAEYQGIINITATPDGRLGFAAHGEGNTLAVIDLETGEKIKDVTLGELPWRAYGTADGRLMIVPNNGDKTISIIETESQTVIATLPGAADMTGVNTDNGSATAFVISRGENKAIVIDLAALAVVGEIALPGTPETGVVTPDGTKLYVALSTANKVAVIDVAARRLARMIDGVGQGPWGATMAGARNYCH